MLNALQDLLTKTVMRSDRRDVLRRWKYTEFLNTVSFALATCWRASQKFMLHHSLCLMPLFQWTSYDFGVVESCPTILTEIVIFNSVIPKLAKNMWRQWSSMENLSPGSLDIWECRLNFYKSMAIIMKYGVM